MAVGCAICARHSSANKNRASPVDIDVPLALKHRYRINLLGGALMEIVVLGDRGRYERYMPAFAKELPARIAYYATDAQISSIIYEYI